MYLNILLIIIGSFTITYFFTPITIKIANMFGLIDDPEKRKHPAHTHTNVIPRAGGVPLFLGIFLTAVFFIYPNNQFISLILGSLFLILLGIWDDKKDLSPYLRFIFNLIIALLIINAGITIPYITNPFGGILNFQSINISLFGLSLDKIFTMLFIVWTMNIVGWSGGVDGQLPGFVSISSLVIGILSIRYANVDPLQLPVTYLSFATFGAFLGFLPWNFYPQKIMPGYGGKTLAGFMLSVLSILSFSKLGTMLLVLAVPITDSFFMLFKRILSGKSPVWASSDHLHHHLLKLGWNKKKIATFYILLSAIFGIMALFLNSQQKIFAIVLIFTLIFAFIVWINYFRKLNKESRE
jgi:UDP-GlcNAc:undecaprenyl-phosphate GlcNAc-1-phosphate transferase